MQRNRKKSVRKAIQFTLMVVGQLFLGVLEIYTMLRNGSRLLGASGSGRTTFVNTLCGAEVLAHRDSDNPDTAHVEQGIKIKPINVGQ
jgi:septin family protein